jgi:hypothetical protein
MPARIPNPEEVATVKQFIEFTDLAVTMAEWLERGVTRALTDLAPRSVIMQ